jgi:alkylhydroperoxidase family enzyme
LFVQPAFDIALTKEVSMPHLAPVTDAQASESVKGIFQNLQAKLGKVLNIFRTMAHAPEVLQATLAFNQAIQKELDPKLRELAYLKTTQVNNCNY